jgi:hypothetical protein
MERVCFGWEILAIKLHCFGGIPTAAAKGVWSSDRLCVQRNANKPHLVARC